MTISTWLSLNLNTIVKQSAGSSPPVTFYRLTEVADRRVTEAGDPRIVE